MRNGDSRVEGKGQEAKGKRAEGFRVVQEAWAPAVRRGQSAFRLSAALDGLPAV